MITWNIKENRKLQKELWKKKPYIGFWADLWQLESDEYRLKIINNL